MSNALETIYKAARYTGTYLYFTAEQRQAMRVRLAAALDAVYGTAEYIPNIPAYLAASDELEDLTDLVYYAYLAAADQHEADVREDVTA